MTSALDASVRADSPFFMVGGLPVHTLVVHFAVVMLPLSAIALIVIILVPKWRGAFVWATLVGLVIGTGAAFISKESGEQLAERIGLPQTHAKWGDLLPAVAVLLFVLACVWLWLERRSGKAGQPQRPLGSGAQLAVGVVAIGVALLSIGITIVVGHTGASAVWASRSLDSEAQEDAPAATPPASAAPGATLSPSSPAGSAAPGYTMADVSAHATATDCWTVVSGTVYDLTQWIAQHPGGPGVIEGMCGVDATAAFDAQHKGQGEPNDALIPFALGPLAATAGPASAAPASSAAAAPAASDPGAYTLADVAAHAAPADCWSAVGSNVYDLTAWIPQHPGGPGVIESMCGVDGTTLYDSQHRGQDEPATALAAFQIGALG